MCTGPRVCKRAALSPSLLALQPESRRTQAAGQEDISVGFRCWDCDDPWGPLTGPFLKLATPASLPSVPVLTSQHSTGLCNHKNPSSMDFVDRLAGSFGPRFSNPASLLKFTEL